MSDDQELREPFIVKKRLIHVEQQDGSISPYNVEIYKKTSSHIKLLHENPHIEKDLEELKTLTGNDTSDLGDNGVIDQNDIFEIVRTREGKIVAYLSYMERQIAVEGIRDAIKVLYIHSIEVDNTERGGSMSFVAQLPIIELVEPHVIASETAVPQAHITAKKLADSLRYPIYPREAAPNPPLEIPALMQRIGKEVVSSILGSEATLDELLVHTDPTRVVHEGERSVERRPYPLFDKSRQEGGLGLKLGETSLYLIVKPGINQLVIPPKPPQQ